MRLYGKAMRGKEAPRDTCASDRAWLQTTCPQKNPRTHTRTHSGMQGPPNPLPNPPTQRHTQHHHHRLTLRGSQLEDGPQLGHHLAALRHQLPQHAHQGATPGLPLKRSLGLPAAGGSPAEWTGGWAGTRRAAAGMQQQVEAV